MGREVAKTVNKMFNSHKTLSTYLKINFKDVHLSVNKVHSIFITSFDLKTNTTTSYGGRYSPASSNQGL